MRLNELDGINKNELSMIEVAHAILEETGQVADFNDLLTQVQKYLGLPEKELEAKMTRFYTDLNIDGSFIALGENRWGLRSWYPIDSIDEEILSTIDEDEVKVRRKKRKKISAFASSEDEDVIDYSDDDPEDTYETDDDEDEDVDVEADEVEEDLDKVDGDDLDDDLDTNIEEDLTIIEDDFEEPEEEEEEEYTEEEE